MIDSPGSYFEVPSTWTTKTGGTLAERRVRFANPSPHSPELIADVLAKTRILSVYHGPWQSVHVVARNSDPVVTVTGCEQYAIDRGWNQFHMPVDAKPPGENDGHMVITNADQPGFLWALGGGTSIVGPNQWFALYCRLWARQRATVGVNGAMGRGMGVEAVNIDKTGGNTACPASADIALGTILKSEIERGVIPHALRWLYPSNVNNKFQCPYPCQLPYDGITGYRVMLNPDVDVNALQVGNALKIALKAAQEYGFILTDWAPDDSSFHAETQKDWSGYSFDPVGASFPSMFDFATWFYQNSRQIPCVEAYPGECAGVDPPSIIIPPLPIPDPVPPINPPFHRRRWNRRMEDR